MLFEARYERFDYPAEESAGLAWGPAHVGFWVKVRCNPSGAELRHEQKLSAASTDEEGQAAWLEYVAPRVPEWNLQERNVDGEVVDVPAPGEMPGNWEAFYLLPWDLLNWVATMIRYAHVPKVLTTLLAPATTRDTTPEEGLPQES